jgi:hypothetical protein
MPAGLALLLAVALGADVRIEPGLRTEALVRRIDPAPTPADKDALDLTANPTLSAAVTGGVGSASLLYNPTFTATDVGPDLRWQHMHQGEARVRLGMRPTWNVQAFASGGIGRSDLISLNRSAGGGAGGGTGGSGGTGTGGAPGTATTSISTIQTLDLMQWRSGMSFQVAPDRRTTLILAAALSEDGGATARSRIFRPVARSSDGSAELGWYASRLDQLGLRLTAMQMRIAALSVDAAVGTALATWRRNLTPAIQLSTGAGATAVQSRVLRTGQPQLGRETQRLYSPAGQLGITKVARAPILSQGQTTPPLPAPGDEDETNPTETTAPPPTQAQAQVQDLAVPGRSRLTDATGSLLATLAGTVDRNSGVATPSFDVTGALRWPFIGDMSLFSDASGTLTWPKGGRRTKRGQADLGASFPLGPRVTCDVGGYGTWQHSDDPAVPNVKEYGAFVRLGLRARPITY